MKTKWNASDIFTAFTRHHKPISHPPEQAPKLWAPLAQATFRSYKSRHKNTYFVLPQIHRTPEQCSCQYSIWWASPQVDPAQIACFSKRGWVACICAPSCKAYQISHSEQSPFNGTSKAIKIKGFRLEFLCTEQAALSGSERCVPQCLWTIPCFEITECNWGWSYAASIKRRMDLQWLRDLPRHTWGSMYWTFATACDVWRDQAHRTEMPSRSFIQPLKSSTPTSWHKFWCFLCSLTCVLRELFRAFSVICKALWAL